MWHGFASRIQDAPKPLPLFRQKSDDAQLEFRGPEFSRKAFRGNPKEMAGLNKPWRWIGGVSDLPFAGTFRRPRLGGPPHWRWTILLALEKILLHRIIYIYNPRSCDCLILDGEIYTCCILFSFPVSKKLLAHFPTLDILASCHDFTGKATAQVDCFVNAPRGHADAVKAALMWLGRTIKVISMAF